MADLCFICNKPLSEGNSVNVVRKVYTSKNSIAASKRRDEKSESSTLSSVPSEETVKAFDFKNLCLFCGKPADEAAEAKIMRYKRRISKVSTLKFKDNVIRRAGARSDSLGELVKSRVYYEHDLRAVKAKYHSVCYSNFLKPVPCLIRKPRLDDRVTQSMQEIFDYMENQKDSQFTLTQIKGIPTKYVPDDKTIILKLQQKYSTDIIIKTKVGSFTKIYFHHVDEKEKN